MVFDSQTLIPAGRRSHRSTSVSQSHQSSSSCHSHLIFSLKWLKKQSLNSLPLGKLGDVWRDQDKDSSYEDTSAQMWKRFMSSFICVCVVKQHGWCSLEHVHRLFLFTRSKLQMPTARLWLEDRMLSSDMGPVQSAGNVYSCEKLQYLYNLCFPSVLGAIIPVD